MPDKHIKAWGHEVWITNTPLYCGKILVLKKGFRCSMHYHKIKTETFYIQKGKVQMTIQRTGQAQKIIHMGQGDKIHIEPYLIHSFAGVEYSEIVEISTQHFEDDSYRLDKSGRA